MMWGGGGGGVRVATSISFSVVCSSFNVTMVTCGFSVFGSSSFTVTIVEMVSSGMKTSEKYFYRKCSYFSTIQTFSTISFIVLVVDLNPNESTRCCVYFRHSVTETVNN